MGREDVRKELDEHLDAINQNTAEIQEVHEYIGEIDLKLEKLTERIDALQALMLSQTETKSRQVHLTLKEREALHVLLSSREPLSSRELGKRCGLTSDVAAQVLYCLKQKQVPVLAHVFNEETLYVLDESFRKLHSVKT